MPSWALALQMLPIKIFITRFTSSTLTDLWVFNSGFGSAYRPVKRINVSRRFTSDFGADRQLLLSERRFFLTKLRIILRRQIDQLTNTAAAKRGNGLIMYKLRTKFGLDLNQ